MDSETMHAVCQCGHAWVAHDKYHACKSCNCGEYQPPGTMRVADPHPERGEGALDVGDEDWTWERFRRLYLHDARFHACVKRVEQEVWRKAEHEYRIALSTREQIGEGGDA